VTGPSADGADVEAERLGDAEDFRARSPADVHPASRLTAHASAPSDAMTREVPPDRRGRRRRTHTPTSSCSPALSPLVPPTVSGHAHSDDPATEPGAGGRVIHPAEEAMVTTVRRAVSLLR
jgi:hypothetical protein